MWSMKIYLFIDWTTFGLLWSHLGAVPRSRLWVNAVHKNQFSLCTGRVFKRAFKVNVQLQFRPTFVRCSRQFWVNATFKNQFFLCTVCPLECAFKVNVQLKPSFIFCSIQFWSMGWLGVEEITSTIQFFWQRSLTDVFINMTGLIPATDLVIWFSAEWKSQFTISFEHCKSRTKLFEHCNFQATSHNSC